MAKQKGNPNRDASTGRFTSDSAATKAAKRAIINRVLSGKITQKQGQSELGNLLEKTFKETQKKLNIKK